MNQASLSPLFSSGKKKDGTYRVIVNLKALNEFIVDQHFKMETLDAVTNIMKRGAYAASLDLKDAYYSVPTHPTNSKYLTFFFDGVLHKFVALPNGLKSGPRIFTKLMKVAFSELHRRGHQSALYLDDVYLQSDSLLECQRNLQESVEWLMALGFVIHPKKSVLFPTRHFSHVAFLLDLNNMTVRLPPEKA